MKTVEIKLASGEKVSLTVQKRIKYSDLSVIATAIRNDVFSDGNYFPYMKELGLVHYVLLYYANYTFEDADEMMELNASNALDPVFKAIDTNQLQTLHELVEDMIDYQRGRSGLDGLCVALLNGMRVAKNTAELAKEGKETKE